MASPQKENGYTPIANEIMEAVAKLKINATQFRILVVVWRYTYGFSRKSHKLSESFISNATNIHKKQIQRELNSLIERNILTVIKEATFSSPRIIQFNKNYKGWEVTKTLPDNGNDTHTGSGLVPSTGSGLATQDKQIYKTNNKTNSLPPAPYEEIKNLYNKTCLSLPKVKIMTDKRKKTIKSRWKQHGDIEVFREIFQRAEASDFLSGRNGKWTNCNFDWLINEANMVKVLEGNYDNKKPPEEHKPKEPEFDFIEYEENGELKVKMVPREAAI